MFEASAYSIAQTNRPINQRFNRFFHFVPCVHSSLVAARRAAVAYIGGAGNAAGSAGLEAVAAVFRGDRNAGVRRTAGDALR